MAFTVSFKVNETQEIAITVDPEESLLDAAKRADIPMDAPCSGNGLCGKCRVKVLAGKAESQRSRHISPEEYAQGFRLACAARAASDMTVLIPPGALAYQNRIKINDSGEREQAVFNRLRGELAELGFTGDSGLTLLPVRLQEPGPGDPMADQERLLRALAVQGARDAPPVRLGYHALKKLPRTLRESGFALTCLVRREPAGDLIMDLFPPDENPVIAGLAIDIGTTTVSVLLVDLLSGAPLALGSGGNGQIRYGADVINRIIESTRPGGLERLRRGVIEECIKPIIQGLCQKAGIPPDRVYRAAVGANTTMTHLFLGISPEYLRLDPYVPAFFDTGSLGDPGLGLHPDAELLPAPAVGSYVGGDITAGVFSSGIYRAREFSLFIDLGTNGELVLGDENFLLSCACSSGPAFEGGDISCGMRATDGAVEACSVDGETLEPAATVIGGQKPAGLCGSGLIDLIGELFRTGIINARGKFIREGRRIRRDEWGMGGYAFALGDEAEGGKDLVLTEGDIDNFIRAKGAIFAAIRAMLGSLELDMDTIQQIYIAGGIGGGINIKNAIRIGMLPNLPVERYRYIGNSSLSGAYGMVTSRGAAEKIRDLGQGITYLELSTHPGYMDEFVAACFLPHTDGSLFGS
jgi:uncharacterized 2Fe-2S/4Fe-4S cluster protein (DUF4445 family)